VAREKAVGLVLFPSAGTDASFGAMVAIENAVVNEGKGIAVRRVDFPYRLAGRSFPDRQPIMVDTVVQATTAMAESLNVPTSRILIGGRSMGGRMASLAVSQGLDVAGLVLVSYPLRPPGKPDNVRHDHFPQVRVSTLFVSGEHDAFCTPMELTESASMMKGRLTMKFVAGNRRSGGHELFGQDDMVARLVAAWIRRR
jgi:uncharacterized protein